MNPSNVSPNVSRALTMLDSISGVLRDVREEIQTGMPRIATQVHLANPAPGNTNHSSTPSGTSATASSTSSNLTAGMSTLAQFREMLPSFRAPDRNTAAAAETRRAFQPYSGPSRSARRVATRSGVRSSTRGDWTHLWYCLGGPEDMKTPTAFRKVSLEHQGLGERVLKIPLQSSPEETKSLIMTAYPRLSGVEYEFMKAAGGGEGKSLLKISNGLSVLGLDDIIMLAGRVRIYIRPAQSICEGETTDVSSNDIGPRADEAPHNGQSDNTPVFPFSVINAPTNAPVANAPILTVEDFRNQVYQENPGTQMVFVQRDDFAMQVVGVYKSPSFNLLWKPQVLFAGEPGNDVGALQREYFWLGVQSLSEGKFNGRLPFFEGEQDHKIPSFDATLLRSGTYKMIGKFMAHGAIHAGLAFTGLSQAVVEYLCSETVDSDTPISINFNDIADYEIRNVLQQVEDGYPESLKDEHLVAKFNSIAEEAGFNEKASEDNYNYMKDHIMYNFVVEKRRPALESIKLAFRETNLLPFLQGKEYLLRGLFPNTKDLALTPEMLVSKINFNTDSVHHQAVKNFILEECEDVEKIKALLKAWTGWAIPSDDELTVEVVNSGSS